MRVDNADCLEWLSGVASGSVDLVLIDPPYGISRETGFQGCKSTPKTLDKFRVSMDFGDWDNGDDTDTLPSSIVEAYRILRDGGSIVCFYDIWKTSYLAEMMTAAKFKQLRMLVWIKTNPVPLNSANNYLSNSKEAAIFGVKKGSPVFNSKFDDGIYRCPSETSKKVRIHPTQKPSKLISEIIEKHTHRGGRVVDFFAGSGTTAVACMRTGREFFGCEKNEEYCDKANERLVAESKALGGLLK